MHWCSKRLCGTHKSQIHLNLNRSFYFTLRVSNFQPTILICALSGKGMLRWSHIAFKFPVACQVAMRAAQEMEAKLAEEEEICNETMKALWEECKPCLRNTCVKFYSRTCSSGSGLVGRQVRASRADIRQSTCEKWVENMNRFHEDVIQPAGLYYYLNLRHTFI